MMKLSHIAAGAILILGAFMATSGNAEDGVGIDANIGIPTIENEESSENSDGMDLNAALESLIVEGVVTGLASDEAGDISDDDTRAHRPGNHRAANLPRCPRCRIFRDRDHCTVGRDSLTNCSGHCKANRQLFNCRPRNNF